jgi:hypothetical protein
MNATNRPYLLIEPEDAKLTNDPTFEAFVQLAQRFTRYRFLRYHTV